jgi:hypothetical protein
LQVSKKKARVDTTIRKQDKRRQLQTKTRQSNYDKTFAKTRQDKYRNQTKQDKTIRSLSLSPCVSLPILSGIDQDKIKDREIKTRQDKTRQDKIR